MTDFYDPNQDDESSQRTPPPTVAPTPGPGATTQDASTSPATTTDAGASTDTTTPPPDQQPPPGQPPGPTQPPLEGYQQGMSPSDYASWYQSMTAAGYSAQQINEYKQSVLQGGTGRVGSSSSQDTFYGPPPYGFNYGSGDPGTGYVGQGGWAGEGTPDEPGVIGEDLGDWRPGDVYTGTGTHSGDFLMTDETFTPDNSSVDAAAGTSMTPWDVTAEQTVQGQMNIITSHMQDNPVYQSLAASLERAQAAHGGENSLMAETAAYNGVVNLAFQVASADAATYARSAEFNASTANQFALSNRQFMQQALLSTQNYQQSQVLQSQQIEGNLQSVSMQIAGQIRATSIGANAQVASAQIGAAAQIRSASIGASAALGAANIQRRTALDSIQANFEGQWALNEQGQAHNLEMSDRTTDNAIRHDIIQGNQTFGQNLTLQMNSESNANLRQLMGSVGQIGATPGLTGEQQANAINQLTQMYHTNQSLTNSFYSSPGYSLSSGQAGANMTGNSGYAPVNAAASTGPGGPTYQQYGDYLSYGQGGYTMTAAPSLQFYGGDGLVHSQGGIPMYGSNLDLENATGNSQFYNNDLTGNNPLGNNPGQVTGGANYGGVPNVPAPPAVTTP